MTPQEFVEDLKGILKSIEEEFSNTKDRLDSLDTEISYLRQSIREAESADWEVEE